MFMVLNKKSGSDSFFYKENKYCNDTGFQVYMQDKPDHPALYETGDQLFLCL